MLMLLNVSTWVCFSMNNYLDLNVSLEEIITKANRALASLRKTNLPNLHLGQVFPDVSNSLSKCNNMQ